MHSLQDGAGSILQQRTIEKVLIKIEVVDVVGGDNFPLRILSTPLAPLKQGGI